MNDVSIMYALGYYEPFDDMSEGPWVTETSESEITDKGGLIAYASECDLLKRIHKLNVLPLLKEQSDKFKLQNSYER